MQKHLSFTLNAIRKTREDAGLTESSYPDGFFLALSEQDNPFLRHQTKQANFVNIPPHVQGLIQVGLMPKPEGSIESYVNLILRYLESYAMLHANDTALMYLTWYKGPDTAKAASARLNTAQGMPAMMGFLQTTDYMTSQDVHAFNVFMQIAAKWKTDTTVLPAPFVEDALGRKAYRPPNRRVVRCGHAAGDTVAEPYLPGQAPAEPNGAVKGATISLTEHRKAYNKGFVVGGARNDYARDILYFRDDNSRGRFTMPLTPALFTDVCWPLNNLSTLSGFARERTKAPAGSGQRISAQEAYGTSTRPHKGIDFSTTDDVFQPCFSIADGTVVLATLSTTYGYVVYIRHKAGISSRYAHLRDFTVKAGDTVKRGQIIGRCGRTTGYKQGSGQVVPDHKGVRSPHLHFEVLIHANVVAGRQPPTDNSAYLSNAQNFRMDPIPILAGAPLPKSIQEGTRPPTDAEKLAQAASTVADAVQNSPTTAPDQTTRMQVYASLKANERDASLASMTRSTFWAAQHINNNVRVNTIEATMKLN